jgi:hypothetical protein
MNSEQAFLASVPPALAIYFEFLSPVSERRLYRNALDTMYAYGALLHYFDTMSTDPVRTASLANVFLNFAEGAISVSKFRPTIVAVATTSLSLVYELHGKVALFIMSVILISLLSILPIFSKIESYNFVDIAAAISIHGGPLAGIPLKYKITSVIIFVNLFLIALSWLL